jgi:hypothetical protein
LLPRGFLAPTIIVAAVKRFITLIGMPATGRRCKVFIGKDLASHCPGGRRSGDERRRRLAKLVK